MAVYFFAVVVAARATEVGEDIHSTLMNGKVHKLSHSVLSRVISTVD
jgi:hypothetical protein